MANDSLIDHEVLIEELRISATYAAHTGALNDNSALETLSNAQNSVSKNENPDIATLIKALNEVMRVIYPMTLADLKFGRDPFLVKNQRKSSQMQFVLTLTALIFLVLIGNFMNALSIEQQAVRDITEIQNLQPQLKLTTLRRLAQYEQPTRTQNSLNTEYYKQVEELNQMGRKMSNSYTNGFAAVEIPLIPFYFHEPLSPSDTTKILVQKSSTVNQAKGSESNDAKGASFKTEANTQKGAAEDLFCNEDSDGKNIKIPDAFSKYPSWMKSILQDYVNDFCFQLRVLSSDGQGLLNRSSIQADFISPLKQKISLRVTWLLPFSYGLLGATVFLMRNVANVRIPSMGVLSVIVRIILGGIAGIVIGWFSTTTSPTLESTSSLSIPFALAFLTGYGIDVLFVRLDKLNGMIANPIPSR